MLRWLMGLMKNEKIRNGEIRARSGMANIRERIREANKDRPNVDGWANEINLVAYQRHVQN